MRRASASLIIFSVLLLALAIWLTIALSEGEFTPTGVAVASPGAVNVTPCPISLSNSQMVPENGMNVTTSVTNTSSKAISTLAFGASHTDKFGNTEEPFQSDLTWDEIIAPGAARPLHWNIPMEQPSLQHDRKPNTSELHLNKVVFADGQVLSDSDLKQCRFDF
jgi:hypothetical protein